MQSMLRIDLEAGRFFSPLEEEHAAARGHHRRGGEGSALSGLEPDRPDALRPRLPGARHRPRRPKGQRPRPGPGQRHRHPHHVRPEDPDGERRGLDLRAPAGGPRRDRRHAGRSPDDPALAAKDPLPRRRPLRHPGVRGLSDALEVAHGGSLRADASDLRHLARGRRDRHRQHHVRLGGGAHAGDRRAPRARCPAPRHPAAVPARGGAPRDAPAASLGVLLGALLALLVSQFFPAQVRPSFAVLGVGVAIVTGILAGLAPSSSASRVTPIEALRFE